MSIEMYCNWTASNIRESEERMEDKMWEIADALNESLIYELKYRIVERMNEIEKARIAEGKSIHSPFMKPIDFTK